MQDKVDVGLILNARKKLAHLVQDLEGAAEMMRKAQHDGAVDSGCAIAWGAAMLTLDVAKNFLSRDPKLAAMFTGTDYTISVANHLLKHYRMVPLIQKSDLLEAMPPMLKVASKSADYTKTTLGGVAGAPKAIPGVLKTLTSVQKKVPGIQYVLNVPVLKGQLTQYQKQMQPYLKKIPPKMGFMVGLATDVLQDGALTLDAYNGYARNKADGGAAILKVTALISKQRRKLMEMDQQIMYLLHQRDYMATLA